MARKIKKFVIGIFSLLVVASFSAVFLVTTQNNNPVVAQTCPTNMSPQQCIEYLQSKIDDIQKQQSQLHTRLASLNNQERNIYNKILITKGKIKELELEIQKLTLSIEITNLEISNLEQLVQKTQEELSQLNLKLKKQQHSILGLLGLKYRFSTIPWYHYLQSGDIFSVLEYISIVNYLLAKQQTQLRYMHTLKSYIQEKQSILEERQKELLEKQQKLEKQNKKLNEQNKELAKQKQEQEQLLARLKELEEKTKQELARLKQVSNRYNEELARVVSQLGIPASGQRVAKGSIIGYQGHTGCAYGSHLHFVLFKKINGRYTQVNPANSGLFSCGSCSYGAYLSSGLARSPLNSAFITQNYHAGHLALDLVSTSAGNQSGARYCVTNKNICGYPVTGCFGLRGEGAPVYSILPGTIVVSHARDHFGGIYTYIIHDPVTINGQQVRFATLYVHLKGN